MRQFIKPAHPGARIPDPHHGTFLPADGIEVEWDHHWEHHRLQGNIVVSDVAPGPGETADEPGHS